MWIEKRPLLEGWDPFNFFHRDFISLRVGLMERIKVKRQSPTVI